MEHDGSGVRAIFLGRGRLGSKPREQITPGGVGLLREQLLRVFQQASGPEKQVLDVRAKHFDVGRVPLGDELFEEVGGHSHATNSRTKSLRSPDRKRSIRFSASEASVFSRSSAMPRALADSSIMSAR